MVEAVFLWRRLVGAQVRSQFQYRVSFTLDLAGNFLISFIDFLAVLVIFHNVPQLGTWNVHEVAFLYAFSSISFALTDLLIGHLDQFPQKIRDGNFDILLVRPRGTLFQVIGSDFQLRRLGKAVQGVIVLVWVIGSLDVHWDAGRGRDARRDGPGRDRHLQLGLGRRRLPRVLDDRRRRVLERVHLRRQLHDAVPHRHPRRMAAPLPRVHRPAGVRLLLPSALRARQARSARAPAVRRVSARRSSRSQRPASPASPGSSRFATTGAPADDRGRAAQQDGSSSGAAASAASGMSSRR